MGLRLSINPESSLGVFIFMPGIALAGWQSGDAAACKAVYAGSIPTPASIFLYSKARVVELVDTRDLKSLGGNSVPVRVRPRAPILDFIPSLTVKFSLLNLWGQN